MLKIVALLLLATTALAIDRPLSPRSRNAATVPVTSMKQLWRYAVGEGSDGITIGDSYICLIGQNLKFVRNTGNGWVMSNGANCNADNRYKLHDFGSGVFGIKNVATQQWWSCRDNGELWGIGSISSWEKFKLFVDAEEDNLVIRSAGWSTWFVYLWSDGYLYCGNKAYEYSGRTAMMGWKVGNQKWTASDEWLTIIEVDNRKGTSLIHKEISYETGYSTAKEAARAGSFSTTATASASFKGLFEAEVSTSIGFDWSNVEAQSFDKSVTDKTTIDVQPGTRFRVQEAVGHFGPFTINSGFVKYVQDTSNGETMMHTSKPRAIT